MPRKTFITLEFFVNATVQPVKESVLSLPAFVNHIRFIHERRVTGLMQFHYFLPALKENFHVDVSLLPLNEQFTRICLHASYASGKVIGQGDIMPQVIHDFEQAIVAALSGDTSQYKPFNCRPGLKERIGSLIPNIRSSINVLFLKRKLS